MPVVHLEFWRRLFNDHFPTSSNDSSLAVCALFWAAIEMNPSTISLDPSFTPQILSSTQGTSLNNAAVQLNADDSMAALS
jgi:hypothetical protein